MNQVSPQVLRHVERGDYTWRTLPPGALRDLARSRDLVDIAAKRGCARAQNHLGMLNETGTPPVAADPAAAVGWYRKAAKRGDIDGYYNLANCALDGVGFSGGRDPIQGRQV
jgi:hypothetical protein